MDCHVTSALEREVLLSLGVERVNAGLVFGLRVFPAFLMSCAYHTPLLVL